MNHLYQGSDPLVINHELLTKAVVDQSPKAEAETIIEREPLRFKDVKELSLSYRRILRIANLWEFSSLTKLQLDNNMIERIESVYTMPNLRWLDLSYNRIKVIENLDALVYLEDLSLFSNNISRLEGLDNQQNLQVLSIGNNQIGKMENILYLRQLPMLGSLGLAGNPVADHPEYKEYVAAFLKKLLYLDYRMVRDEWREAGLQKHSDVIGEMELLERREVELKDAKEQEDRMMQRYREAFVEGLNTGQLFDALFEDDADGEHLGHMTGADDLQESLKGLMVPVCVQLFDLGIEREKQRADEIAQLVRCLDKERRADEEKAVTVLNDFLEEKEGLLAEIGAAIDIAEEKGVTDETVAPVHVAIQAYQDSCDAVWSELMGNEVQLNDGLEEVIAEFGRNLTEMVSGMLEGTSALFASIRDMEATYTEQLTELAMHVLEKVIRNDEDVDMPEETMHVFSDKESVMALINGSHEWHTQTIDGREDELNNRLRQWMEDIISNFTIEEEKRNRDRVIEINHFLDRQREELDGYEVPQMPQLELEPDVIPTEEEEHVEEGDETTPKNEIKVETHNEDETESRLSNTV